MNLRYPWWDRWQSLRARNLPQARAERALSIAADWIENHAFEAERDGWQPVHILRPFDGLAWRWPYLPETVTRPGLLSARLGNFDFVYRSARDGSSSIVRGDARHKALMLFGLPGEYTQ